jgi:predicted ATPase
VWYPGFVGRAAELDQLVAAFERAAGGAAEVAFVAGAAGSGKTRLLRELEHCAAERGAWVLRGECKSFGAAQPGYAPITGALRALARDVGPAAFERLLGPTRSVLARLLPELRAGDGVTDPGGALAQARLFRVLRTVLARLAAQRPVLLVVEDIHWADRSTLDLLASLLRGGRGRRVLLVCSYRSDELHRRHRLRPFLAAHERAGRVALEGLSPSELAAQVAEIAGGPADAHFVGRLHARSEGNPLHAEELLAAAAHGTSPLSAGLGDLLRDRVARLPLDARVVLRVAAAAGRVADDRLVSTVAALREAARGRALRAAVAGHVLVERGGEHAFRHDLLCDAAYADVLPGERAALHVALAEALRDDPGLAAAAPEAELAHHWAAAHRIPEALAAHVRAGLEAERLCAFAEAEEHFERALEVWDLVDDAGARSALRFASVVEHAAHDAALAGDHHRAARLGRALEIRAAPRRSRLGLV